jgi:hypothetical protein
MKVVVGVTTVESSKLDKRVIFKRKIFLIIFIKAIAVDNQVIGNRIRVECNSILDLES